MKVRENKNNERSCYIIGEGSLTLNCAEWVLLQGCHIRGIVSSFENIEKWANENKIPYFESKNKHYEAVLLNDDFDYLFSIVNPAILKYPLLSKPRIFAINFHDSMLPRYAGMHSTSWAIINGEREHGITWHTMLEKVDAGDILKQASVIVEPDDTAISLNQKCYETAFATFKKLLSDLLTDVYKRQPQQVDPSTYCGLYVKPEGNGWINWNQKAEKIETIYRATQLGNHSNFFSTTKLVCVGEAYIVDELTIIPSEEINLPGTVLLRNEEEIQIATQTNLVSIKRLKNLDGIPCNLVEEYKKLGIKTGTQLFIPDRAIWEGFREKSVELAKYELFWLAQWKRFKPANLPRLEKVKLQNLEDSSENTIVFNLPESFKINLSSLFPSADNRELLLALCLLYLYRFGNKETLGIVLGTASVQQHADIYPSLIANVVPLTLELNDEMDFGSVLDSFQKKKLLLDRKKTFLRDLQGRYPELNSVEKPIIAVSLNEGSLGKDSSYQCPINIYVKEDKLLFSIKQIVCTRQLEAVFWNIPDHLEALLAGIIENPKKSIAYLPLLGPKMFQRLVSNINNTAQYYPDKTVYRLFEEQVEKNPYRDCIFYKEEKISFSRVNTKANQLAHFLHEKNVKQGSRITVFMDRGIDRIIAQLAIGKAGCSFVVIDIGYPEERIFEILNDSQANCVLTHKNYSEKLRDKFKYFAVDKLEESLNLQPKHNLTQSPSLDEAIYFLPTSGTTGKSKLVKVLHKGVVNLVFSLARKLKITDSDVILNYAESTFDVAYWEIFASLICGAKLRIPTQDERSPGPILANTLRKYDVTVAGFPPSVLKLTPPANLPALRCVIAAGEACTEEVLMLWKEYYFWNAYGPTETTIYTVATYHPPGNFGSHTDIGLPLPNVKIYILDENLQLVGIGQEGQLFIGGVCVGGGYENKKQLTDTKFISDPFMPGERIYATGDLVRFMVKDNNEVTVEYLDRIDTLTKVNGLRVDLSGIEASLENHPFIQEALVAVKQVDNGHKQIVAYIIQAKEEKLLDEPLTVEGLQSYLSRTLPRYEIPVIFYNFKNSNFPRTQHDKRDRNAVIQGNYPSLPVSATEQILPETPEQVLLAGLWQQVLHREQISIHDSFVALGGDSILAMQISAELQQRSYYLSIKDFFKTPTIAELATKLERINFQNEMEEISVSFPLTPIQHWFFEKKLKVPYQFSQVCELELKSDTHIERLLKILQGWGTFYPTFLLRFKQTRVGWQQIYNQTEGSKPLIQVDHAAWLDESELKSIVDDWRIRLQSDFNIEKGPVMGAVILKNLECNASSNLHLIIALHHLVMDGVSWRVCLQDLEKAYKLGDFSSSNFSLSTYSSSFKKWSSSLQVYKQQQEANSSDFWKKTEANVPLLCCDHKKGPNLERYSDNITEVLTEEFTLKLLQNEARPRELLIAVLVKVLLGWMGSREVALDLETHGRESAIDPSLKLESAIGWFTSLFPLRFNITDDTSLKALLKLVTEQLAAIPNNGLDYGVQRYLLHEKRLIDYSQICFNYWGQFDQLFSDASPFQFKRLDLVSHPKNERTHLLVIEAAVIKGQLHVTCNYSKNHFLEKTMRVILKNYCTILEDYLCHSNEAAIKNVEINKNLLCISAPIQKSYPLSPMQKGLLFHYLVNPRSESYVVQLLWELDSSIEVSKLWQAFEYLVARHDSLRTAFEWEGLAEPLQHVYKDASLSLKKHDWNDVSENDLEKKLHQFLQADRQLGFNLNKPHGLRINTILLPNGRYNCVLTVSHLLFDGWSLALLFQELEQYYQYSAQASKILASSVPYQNYIAWLSLQNLDKAKEYWTAYFKGMESTVECAIIQPIKREDLFKLPDHRSQTIELSTEVMGQIENFCRSQAITFNSFIQGVWGLILHYYSGGFGNEDVVFGITVSNRACGLEKIVGLLINTLPLRIRMKNLTTIQYFQAVQEQIFDMLRFAYTPLDHIQTWCGFASTSPLFETLVVTENYPKFVSPALKLDFSDLEIIDPVHYPLALIASPGKKLYLKFNYDNNRIQEASIQSLIGHIRTVFQEILAKPHQLISQLNFLTATEYQLMHAAWEATKMDTYVPNESLLGLFEAQVKSTPDRLSGVYQEEQLSFSQLNESAKFLSKHLLKKGICSGDVIAICIDRNLKMLIGQLAIVKTNATIVMIDIKNSTHRINYILEDCKPALVLTESNLNERIEYDFPREKTVFIDKVLKKMQNSAILSHLFCFKKLYRNEVEAPYYSDGKTDLDAKVPLFYVYTSGTTGKPKAVVQSHEMIANLVTWQNKAYLGCALKVAQFASYGFDVCQQEIFFSLLNGHTLYFIPDEIKLTPSLLVEYIACHKINILFLPTSFLSIFCQAANQIPDNLSELVEIIVAGEELKIYPEILEFFKNNSHVKLTNHYGPSETHVVTSYTLTNPISEWPFKCPIGKSIANTKVYIRDLWGRLLPPLCVGEIWISGPGVALAYWGHPELTEEKIVGDPYSNNSADHMYSTGDLGYQTMEGDFVYVGRCDDRIKIDGTFVKLAEVVAVYEGHPEISKATVLVDQLQNGIKKLVVYLIRKEGSQIDKYALQRFLENTSLSIRPAIVFVSYFPLIANGKIDKSALLALGTHETSSEKYLAAATSPIELKLENIWAKVLGIKGPISILDNFFYLGGKSLLALHLLGEIRNQFKVDLTLKDLYRYSTISELAIAISRLTEIKCGSAPFSFFEKKKNILLRQCIIPLHTFGNKTPLFLVHPVGGAVFWFLKLAITEAWDLKRPLYGIQDLGIETLTLHFQTVEEMAIAYVNVIREIQPHGPYLIGGASAGAATSIAMAQEFKRLGEEVAFIGLFDGWAPYPEQLKENRNLFDAIMRGQHDKWKREFADKKIESADKLLEIQWIRAQQNANYKIPYTDQTLTLFKAEDVSPVYRAIDAPDNHWTSYCKSLEIHNVTGGHDTIFEGENVSNLAKLVCDCLDKVDLKSQLYATESEKIYLVR